MKRTHPFIAFEGPIAAGKTTLAGLLASHLRSELIREDFEGNEFLADFYADRERWALAMQLWFLGSRRDQMNSIVLPLARPLVVDYSYLKDGIYARVLLKDRELRLYNHLTAELPRNLARPTLIVHVDARNEVLLDRIRRRERPYEAVIDNRYLDIVRAAYDKELGVSGVKVLRYNTSDLDLRSETQMNEFYEKVMATAAASI
jgi:deoxyadenosine/deoxycytidine kinase